jgi:predicted anti-sigma-YlaC factor YlaD
MNCGLTEDTLWAYYDGQCKRSEREAMEQHLNTCSNCRSILKEWRTLACKTFSQRTSKAPTFLWTRVLAGIEAEEQKRVLPAGAWWSEWRWMGRLTAAIALLVFLGAGFVLYRSYEGIPIDILMEGQTRASNAIRLSRSHAPTQTEVTAWILGGKPWEDD